MITRKVKISSLINILASMLAKGQAFVNLEVTVTPEGVDHVKVIPYEPYPTDASAEQPPSPQKKDNASGEESDEMFRAF